MTTINFKCTEFYKFYAEGKEYIVSPVEDKTVVLDKMIIKDRDCDLDRVYEVLDKSEDNTEDVLVRFFFDKLPGNKDVGNITPYALRKVEEDEKSEILLGLVNKYKPDTRQEKLNHILYIVKGLIEEGKVKDSIRVVDTLIKND